MNQSLMAISSSVESKRRKFNASAQKCSQKDLVGFESTTLAGRRLTSSTRPNKK